MKSKDDIEQLSEQETKRRMDDALRRALNTPPQPHKPISDKAGSKVAPKPHRGK